MKKRRPNKQTARRRPARNKKIAIIPPRRSAKRSLADLATKINAGHKAVIACMHQGLRRAITTGHLLLEAKARLKHGRWLPWLHKHCDVNERSSQLYMNLARHEDEIRTVADLADFSMRGAIALITKADEADVVEGIAQQPDASDADNTDTDGGRTDTVAASSTADVGNNFATGSENMQSDRPAPIMADDAKWRLNLRLGGDYLFHIPHTPITRYLHPEVHYSADQWDEIARFLNKLAAAMRNAVAALDEANKEEETDGRGAPRPSAM